MGNTIKRLEQIKNSIFSASLHNCLPSFPDAEFSAGVVRYLLA
jgi:hypothetical protein